METQDVVQMAEQIGISTNLFLDDPNPELLIDNLASEFRYVEVELEGTLRQQTNDVTDFRLAQAIRSISEKRGATINIHAPYIGVDYLFGEDRQGARDLLLRSARFAIEAGAKTMTFHPGFRFPPRAPVELRQQAVGTIQELAYDLFHLTKHYSSGLVFCLENSGAERPFFTLSEDEEEDLFSTSPLCLTMDIVHAASYCTNPDQLRKRLSACAKHVGNVHFADVNFPKHLHLPLGTGDLDFHGMLTVLAEQGYRGPFIVEEVGAGHDGKQYLLGAIEYRAQLRGGLAAGRACA